MSETPSCQLTDAERTALKSRLHTQSSALKSRTIGFKISGEAIDYGALVAKIPDSLDGAGVSVCGLKQFLIDEQRDFTRPDGTHAVIDCHKIAALDIVDSPVHIHRVTREVYAVLHGNGRMVLGNRVVDVGEGSLVQIPPGIEHGLAANDPQDPVRVLLTFTPGIASKDDVEFRDEAILHERASVRIKQLLAEAREVVGDVLHGAEQ